MYKRQPFTPATNTEADKRLLIGRDSAEWFAAKKVKCVGFGDGVSIENSNEDVCPFHDILMEKDIVFLEVLCNLEPVSYTHLDVYKRQHRRRRSLCSTLA